MRIYHGNEVVVCGPATKIRLRTQAPRCALPGETELEFCIELGVAKTVCT